MIFTSALKASKEQREAARKCNKYQMNLVNPNILFSKEQKMKMTREQALEKCKNLNNWPDILEALGVIEFEKKSEVRNIFELKESELGTVITSYIYDSNIAGREILNIFGAVRVELWPEGLVLWVGGQIVWKSWEKYYKKGDKVVITGSNLNSSIIGNIK